MRKRPADDPLTGAIIGCFLTVYARLGYGLPESHYAAALAYELAGHSLFIQREVSIEVRYCGHPIGYLQVDLIVERTVLVELKTGPRLDPFALRQLYNYLRCSELEVGLLLYFGPEPVVRRLDCPRERRVR